jgi:hypothetical protein
MLATLDHARDWVRTALDLLLRYRRVMRPGALARDLVDLSRALRRLHALVKDGASTRAVVVGRPGELSRRETARLLAALRAAGLAVSARAVAEARGGRAAVLRAPATAPPSRGVAALEARSWRWSVAG